MEKEGHQGWIALIVILFVVILVAYFLGQGSNNSQGNSISNDQQKNSAETPVASPANLALKSKCAEDGASFVQNYEITNNIANAGGFRPVWFDAQFHYDTKMNTCLTYVGYVQEEYENGVLTDNFTIYSVVENFVFDIYSNQALLQSVNNRTTANGGQNTDTLAKYAPYQTISNLSENDFSQRLQVLMSE